MAAHADPLFAQETAMHRLERLTRKPVLFRSRARCFAGAGTLLLALGTPQAGALEVETVMPVDDGAKARCDAPALANQLAFVTGDDATQSQQAFTTASPQAMNSSIPAVATADAPDTGRAGDWLGRTLALGFVALALLRTRDSMEEA